MTLVRLIFLIVISPMVAATTFRTATVNEQVKEAQGIFIGHYLKKKTVQLEDNSLATQMVFKMNKELGLQSELFGQDEIIVHYPGGSLGGKTVKVEGVPDFMAGEKVVLLVKNQGNRYWGLNLGLGTFKVINFGRDTLLINSIFPDDPRVSQMKIEDFEKAIKNIKGMNLKVVEVPLHAIPDQEQGARRAPASISEGKNRSVASHVEARENNHNRPGLSVFWLVVTFSILGGIFRFSRQGRTK